MKLTDVPGIGPALSQKFSALGIATPRDALFHLPLRYEDRSRIQPIAELRLGQSALVAGQLLSADIRFGRRRSLLLRLEDDSGELNLRLFHFSRAQQQALRAGVFLRVFGELRPGAQGPEMVHPEYRILPREQALQAPEPSLTPVYPTTAGLSQSRIRNVVGYALKRVEDAPDYLADAGWSGMGLVAALNEVHAPKPQTATADNLPRVAMQRLAFEEFLAHRLAMLNLRLKHGRYSAYSLPGEQAQQSLLKALPFELTGAQQRVLQEINSDIARTTPMLRLVQGDVGSGKTAVAAAAAVSALAAGLQVALMAPTEILARQHHHSLSAWLEPLGYRVALLLGGMKASERKEAELAAKEGPVLMVGTQALFQESWSFGSTALMIVDEQHRFGVEQRLALREKAGAAGRLPHQLVMTATPIPRTLAQTFYADLDVSVIDELPPGRQPIQTVALPDSRRETVIERVHAACAEGRQAYWVCPVIEESDWANSAEETAQTLQSNLPDLRIGLVHGRLKAAEKNQIMQSFANGELHVLVATTVIEVGVDVPNASVMVIDNAERMGLAQLHQLRGRVGRGQIASHCVLLYRPPLSDMGRARLDALRQESSGFRLAERDLELRGAGEILGSRQSGEAEFRLADLQRDAGLLPQVQAFAETVQRDYPQFIEPLIRRWLSREQRYAQA